MKVGVEEAEALSCGELEDDKTKGECEVNEMTEAQ